MKDLQFRLILIFCSAVGELDFSNYKSVLYPAVLDIVTRKPIDVQVDGKLFVTFMGINRTINFSDEEFRYSDDIIEEVGLGEKYDKTFENPRYIRGLRKFNFTK